MSIPCIAVCVLYHDSNIELFYSETATCLADVMEENRANLHADPFAEADEDTGETKQSQNYIHIRIQRMSFPCS